MALPPVIQRIREKGLSESEIRAFVASGFRDFEARVIPPAHEVETSLDSARFRDLTRRIYQNLEDSAARFISLSDEDPYWRAAPRDQNFESALQHFLRHECQQQPEDERVLWSLAGIEVLHCDNDFGRKHWLSLAARDPRNLRWMVEAAMVVSSNSGTDTTAALCESLRTLEARFSGLQARLAEFVSGADEGLAQSSRAALAILGGSRISEVG
jgi:hypothetical protein